MHATLKGLAILGAVSATGASAAEFVVNGGFEAGNTGFTSGYTYVATPGPNALVPEGTYTVGTNSSLYHYLWASVGPRSGLQYFIANGSPGTDVPAWQQTLTGLTVGKSYNFSAYATNVCCNAAFGGNNGQPVIVAVNGVGLNVAQTVSGPAGEYVGLSGSFVADATSATLTIFNDNSVASGNDFGLDDISVTGGVPEPATWAMLTLGFGLVGTAVRRRRRVPGFA